MNMNTQKISFIRSTVSLLLSTAVVFSLHSTVRADQASSKSTFSAVTGKKLIETGFDMAYPEYIRDHIQEIEKRPFEGIMFRLPSGGGNLFDTAIWDKNQKEIKAQLKILQEIKWGKLTDNFLITGVSTSKMDWYDDAEWKEILAHAQFCAKAARIARCVGLEFDPEPYGSLNPWDYSQQTRKGTYSYEKYSKQAHKRGRQFMHAMTREFPDLKLLMFFQYKELYEAAHQPLLADRKAALQKQKTWSLLLPFLNGMLEEASKNIQLIDGNESAYWYKSSLDYYHAYWVMHQGAKINVPDALKQKYDITVRAANAIYVDDIFNLREDSYAGYTVSSGMTPEERAKWFEHNVYYALKTSDEYAWIWGERLNWWTNKGLPPGIEEAIIAAKEKLQKGDALGYDLKSTFDTAQMRLSKMLQGRLIRRTAIIPEITPQDAPAIDGKLDDEIYQQQAWLENFVTVISPKKEQQSVAATRAWMAYDNENLYIAFHSDEPDLATQKVFDAPRDGAVWNGENIDFSILKPGQKTDDPSAQYYHFILNPANVQWDSIDSGKQSNTAFNADWKSATSRDSKGWTAEIALSWKSIGITNPQKGMHLRGNLARFRVADKTEGSSWSQFIGGFQEPENFGTFILE